MDERAAEVAEVVEFVVFHPQDKGEQNLMAQSGRHIVDPEAEQLAQKAKLEAELKTMSASLARKESGGCVKARRVLLEGTPKCFR